MTQCCVHKKKKKKVPCDQLIHFNCTFIKLQGRKSSTEGGLGGTEVGAMGCNRCPAPVTPQAPGGEEMFHGAGGISL